jgi:hypothetical protein
MSLSRPIPVQNLEPQSKFEEEDLPKILAACHNAHHGKQAATVTIKFADNGGVVGIVLETKKSFK